MNKTILEQLLSNKPDDTKRQVGRAFSAVDCDFEFAVSVAMDRQQKHMDEASARGFAPVWCNADRKSAIIYGAGKVSENGFVDCMTWLNEIRVKSDVTLVHLAGRDGEKLIELT